MTTPTNEKIPRTVGGLKNAWSSEAQRLAKTSGMYVLAEVDSIYPSPLNPRKHFDEDALAELAESLKTHGLMEPIVVRYRDGSAEKVIVAGERRWRAAKLAGLKEIPVLVRTDIVSDQQALELALIENLVRRDIDPIEEAWGYDQLARMGYTQTAIGEKVGRKQNTISHRLGLLKLPEAVQAQISAGQLSPSHGEALLGLKDVNEEIVVAIAAAVAEKKLPASLLESGRIPSDVAEDLLKRRLIRDVTKGKFNWREHCEACPFGAFRRSQHWGGYCLKPEHYTELNKAEEAAQQAVVEEQKAAAAAKGLNVPERVPQFSYNTMEEIGRGVAGCSPTCPCRSAARMNGRIVAVCTDKKRYAERIQAQKEESSRQFEQKLTRKMEQAIARLNGSAGVESLSPWAAILAGTVFRHIHNDLLTTLFQEAGLTLDARGFNYDIPCGPLKATQTLSRLPVSALLKLALTALMRQEAQSKLREFEYYGEQKTPILDRMLSDLKGGKEQEAGDAPSEVAVSETEVDASLTPETCGRCGEEIAIDLLGCAVVEERADGVTVLESGVRISTTGFVCPRCADCDPAREPEFATTTAEGLVG